jgi:hypothetical protein
MGEKVPNDEIPFRDAGKIAGYAYNTIKKLRYLGELPFPVYQRRLAGRMKPMLYCKISEIEEWKTKATVQVPAGVLTSTKARRW